jgi:dTDP-4-dehydrorhamnose 3,5-epimerase
LKIKETFIKGLYVIEPRVFEDERGYFFESFNEARFKELGLSVHFVQDNQSKSKKNVLRGLHFQNPPAAQGKLIQVIKGSVLDVAVDIRKNSETYGKYFALVLSEQNKKMMYLSEGFAHGFLTLEDDTIFAYKCTDFYNPSLESGILWNDADLNIDWKVSNPIVAEKDKKAQKFKDFVSNFTR